MEAKLATQPNVAAGVKKLGRYVDFCAQRMCAPFPPSYETVGDFLLHLVSERNGSTRSIDNDKSQLKVTCEVRQLGWLSYTDGIRLRRLLSVVKGEDFSESNVKDALRFSTLRAIIAKLDLDDPVQLLKATVLVVPHNLLLRVGEMTAGIKVQHFTWRLAKRTRNLGFSLRLRRTKTCRTGSGVSVALDNFNHPFSAVSLLHKWWTMNGYSEKPEAYVFPAIIRGVIDHSRPMSGDFIRNLIKLSVSGLGLDPSRYSGHSLRAGGATDLFASRIPFWIIKKMGRWSSDAALKYYRSDEDVVASVRQAFQRVSLSAM